eukprot:920772-Pleurochrysis_carterae.AAC.2
MSQSNDAIGHPAGALPNGREKHQLRTLDEARITQRSRRAAVGYSGRSRPDEMPLLHKGLLNNIICNMLTADE